MDDRDLYIKQLKEELNALQLKVSSLETGTPPYAAPQNTPASEIQPPLPEILPYDSIFNETEFTANGIATEPTMIEVRSYLRAFHALDADKMITLETEYKKYSMNEDELCCPHCGTKRVSTGSEVARTEVDFIPGKLKARNFIRSIYLCPQCKTKGHNIIKRAVIPSPVIRKSLASPAAVAHVICQKYLYFTSFFTQEQAWKEYNVSISRETLANWVAFAAVQWLLPFYEYLKKELMKRNALFTAQIKVPLIKDKNKLFSSQACMWVFRTGFSDEKPLVLFNCTSLKSGTTPKKFLRSYKGFLHVNSYEGYEQVKTIPLCVSWLYVRNLFKEAMSVPSKKTATADATMGYQYCEKIIAFEKTLDGKTDSQREQLRREHILSVIDSFFAWLSNISPPQYSRLEKAVQYALVQKDNLKRYLNDGSCFISNEAAEQSLSPFIPSQKINFWELCDCSAQERQLKLNRESISIYSLIETAKANGLDIFKYFVYLFEELPGENFRKDHNMFQKYLPWSEQVQNRCKPNN